MNPNLAKLFSIGQKKQRRIIGLMSGTSLDGLDVALCTLSGAGRETEIVLDHFETISYADSFKNNIRQVFAKKNIDFEFLCTLNASIGSIHGQIILDCLQKWHIQPEDIDLIASHGQTVYHAPKKQHYRSDMPNATLQIGDGDHIAVKTGIITISDFRQKHVAAGGEGAPLAAYGDFYLFSSELENRILLNIGGIANFTFLPKSGDSSYVFTMDTGPGNTLLDYYTQQYFGLAFDKNGEIAASGQINRILLEQLKSHPYFKLSPPKTTGPEVFNHAFVSESLQKCGQTALSPKDLLATLTRFSAETIADAILKATVGYDEEFVIYTSGGGANNPLLIRYLQEKLPANPIENIQKLGVNGDAKEAILFALLANETVAGVPQGSENHTETPKICMGKISFPQ